MGFPRLPLLWRVFAINAGLLLAGTLVLALSPGRIHAPIAVVETLDLVIALIVMVAANLFLLRQTLAPVSRLVERMRTVDLLRPGERLAERGGPEVSDVVRAFNHMLDRLEDERQESNRRVLAAQEAERLRVARHLHDAVGQVLTGVLLQLDALGGAVTQEQRTLVDETKNAARSAIEEVRRIAQELRPQLLEHLGLVSALTELSQQFARQSGIEVERHFEPKLPELTADAELAVYRVTQESLTNIARHADASRVLLTLAPGAGSVVLRVVDDGVGLDKPIPQNGAGGLRGMRERAVLVGGALAVKAGPDGGVEVRLEVPAAGT
jgi:two-component system sensor histidine kinase UhpB